MKQLIILFAVLPLLLVFMMQFGVQQNNMHKQNFVADVVHAAGEQAKKDGCYTAANIHNVKTKIADKLGVDEDEIIVNATSTPRYRTNEFDVNELIQFYLEVPVGKIMAGNKFFGISDAENTGRIVMENAVASEHLMP